jgi:hypothetical protein
VKFTYARHDERQTLITLRIFVSVVCAIQENTSIFHPSAGDDLQVQLAAAACIKGGFED